MSQSLWIGSTAVVLLGAAVALANDAPDETQAQVREDQATVVVEPGRRSERDVRVQVFNKLRPSRLVRGQATPADVLIGGEFGPPEVVKLGEYWLGVECRQAAGPLCAQLGLPEGHGLVAENVVPDSPAAKAGIERFDVLVKAGDKPLAGVRDLIEAVEQAEDNELGLELIRRGQKQTVQATPAKRPQDARPQGAGRTPGGDWMKVEKWLGRDLPDRLGKGRTRFRFLHPGTILPFDAQALPHLPGNMSLRIHKQGDEPARIVVERGDEKWEVSEDQLDKLPEDIRPHVERMLGGPSIGTPDHSGQLEFDFVPDWATPGPPAGPAPSVNGRLQQRLEKRMDEMNQRIEQLHKSMQELFRRHRPHDTPAEESSDDA